MSAAAQTKIFGMRVGVDPKILVLGLVAVAGLLFWYNSRGDEAGAGAGSSGHAEPASANPALITKSHSALDRRRGARDDRGTLRLKSVDPTRGDIDPILRLDFLARLGKVQEPTTMRNLFETGPAALIGGGAAMPNRIIPVKAPVMPPIIKPAPLLPTQMTVNIPLKYYGFARPSNPGESSRGFFMDGDNILVAVEGQLLQHRYLVVQLTPNSAKFEDTQLKMAQTVPVVPEALAPSGGIGRAEPQPGGFPGMMQQSDDNQ